MSQRKRNRLSLDFSILILTVSSFFTFNFLPCSGQNIPRANTENLQQNGVQTESLGIGDVNQRQMQDCPTDVRYLILHYLFTFLFSYPDAHLFEPRLRFISNR